MADRKLMLWCRENWENPDLMDLTAWFEGQPERRVVLTGADRASLEKLAALILNDAVFMKVLED